MLVQAQDPPERPLLATSRIGPGAALAIARFHADVVGEISRAVSESPVVVVGMAWNKHVSSTRKALAAAGFEARYLEYGSYVSQWRQRLAIKLWSGWPTFPQVFVRGTLLGGEDLTLAAIADGSLRRALGETSSEARG